MGWGWLTIDIVEVGVCRGVCGEVVVLVFLWGCIGSVGVVWKGEGWCVGLGFRDDGVGVGVLEGGEGWGLFYLDASSVYGLVWTGCCWFGLGWGGVAEGLEIR